MQCACAMSSMAWPVLQYFSTLFHKQHDIWKEVTEHKMCVLIFSTSFVWNISHSKKKWARYDQKCILVFTQGTLYSRPILVTLEFSWQIFEKSSNIKFYENVPWLTKSGWVDVCLFEAPKLQHTNKQNLLHLLNIKSQKM